MAGITANNKVYDRLTTATLITGTAALVGVVGGDTVTLNTGAATGTFSDFNVGTAKTVTVAGLSISGASAGNYTLTQPTTTADITQKALTVGAAGLTPANKVYDGTAAATLTIGAPTLTGVIAPDVVTLNTAGATGTFSDKNVGTGKTVQISGLTLGGANAANYSLTQPTRTADITALALTVSAAGVNKVYDGNTTATVTLSDDRVTGDVLSTSYASASFADKNVGTAKTVSVSGISISGTDAGNYTFNTTASTAADITALALTVSAAGVNKVYDGNTTATVTLSDDRVTGDVLSTSYASAAFADKAVGNGKPVSVSGIAISGADAGNYTINTTASTTADITALALTVTGITANNKVYDGNTTATLNTGTAALVGVVSGDLVTLDATGAAGAFSDANVGNGKTVTISGLTLSGTDAGNYTLTQPMTTADITPASTTTSLASSANPSVFGASVTFTAAVSPSTATGTVQFYADGALLGSDALSSGTAGVSTALLSVGTHVITGTYSGDSNFNASTSDELVQTVSATCLSITSTDFDFTPSAPTVGQPVTFNAVTTGGTQPITYTWNFGHGADVVTTVATTVHSFPLTATVQTYAVTLTAENDCSSQSATPEQVTVRPFYLYLPIIMRN